MNTNKDILIGVIPSLATTLGLLIIISLFSLEFLGAAIIIMLFTIVTGARNVYKDKLSFEQLVKNVILVGALLLFIWTLSNHSGLSELSIFLITGLVVSVVIIYTRRSHLVEAMRYIEKKHFGETMEERRERLKK